MTVKFTNNASTTVATGINTSATSLTVASASAFPQLAGADDYCYLTIQQATGTGREVVKATALSTNTFTITRAQDGTSAGTWSAGDIVELRMTAALLTDVIDAATVDGVKSNFQYTPTAGQTVFSGADNSSNTLVINQSGLVNTYMNGVRLVQGTDYTVSAANNTITLTTGATTSDIIDIEVYGNFTGQSGAAVAITGGSITGTAITATTLGASGTATLNTFVSNNSTISGGTINNVAIGGTTQAAGSFSDLTATTSLQVPAGTTAQRPSSPAAGSFRYNTTSNQFEGYSSSWGAISGGGGGGGATSAFSVDSYTANGSTTAFAISQSVSSENNLIVFIEGIFQQQDAYVLSGNTLTFVSAPANGNKILIYSIAAAVSGSNLNIDSMTGDGSDTTLTLSIIPVSENNTQVFIDGVYQNKDTYSISGSTLTFSTAPPSGSAVEVMTLTQTDINVPVDNTITSAKLSGDLTTPGALTVTGALTLGSTAITATGTELNYVDGVTSAIQTQIDAKAPLAQPQFTDRVGIGVAAHASAALNITTANQHMRLNNGSELGVISLLSSGELELWAHGADETINFRTGGGSGTVAMNVVGTKVGIGRVPRVALDVAGEVAIQHDANYGLRFYNQSQNNWSFIGNDVTTSLADLRFGDSTGEVMRVSGGNLGLGTQSPNNYGGYSTLTINGTTAGLIDLEANGTLKGEVYAEAGGLGLQAVGATNISFKTNYTERFKIDSGGSLTGTCFNATTGEYVGNLNDLKKTGFYRSQNNNTNNPSQAYYSVIVYGNQGNVTAQIATLLSGPATYVRSFNTSWTSWVRIDD